MGSADDAAKNTERGNSPHRNISPTGLDKMDKGKQEQQEKWENSTTTTMKDRNNEHKHQNDDQTRAGCHKPLTYCIYQTHPFCSNGTKNPTRNALSAQ
jgi:hypothetical protein